MPLPFIKMHGLGNCYIYLDLTRDSEEGIDLPDLARRVSDVHFGVGSDGLIAILPGREGDFTMRIFNADGSEAEMCGNGIRCLGKFVFERGLTHKTELEIDTPGGLRTLFLKVDGEEVHRVTVDMGPPRLGPEELPMQGVPSGKPVIGYPLIVGSRTIEVTGVSVGNPHCVVFAQDLSDDLVLGMGPEIERHAAFPRRTNVEFVKVLEDSSLAMRVWERGSGETMACGTGACAVGVAASLNEIVADDRVAEGISIHLRGGDLDIRWSPGRSVFMTGPAEEVFSGVFTDAWMKAGTPG